MHSDQLEKPENEEIKESSIVEWPFAGLTPWDSAVLVQRCAHRTKRGADVTLAAYEGHGHMSLMQLYLLRVLEDFERY